jgi:hypothetical protein
MIGHGHTDGLGKARPPGIVAVAAPVLEHAPGNNPAVTPFGRGSTKTSMLSTA